MGNNIFLTTRDLRFCQKSGGFLSRLEIARPKAPPGRVSAGEISNGINLSKIIKGRILIGGVVPRNHKRGPTPR